MKKKQTVLSPKLTLLYLYPPQQLYLIDLGKRTNSKIKDGDNVAKVKRLWIEASNELCDAEDFDPYGLKSDFIGNVVNIFAHDDGTTGIKIKLSGSVSYWVKQWIVNKSLNNTIEELDDGGTFSDVLGMGSLSLGTVVKFSGYFKKGNMEQNECLDAGLDSNPEFVGETFTFNFTKIEKITDTSQKKYKGVFLRKRFRA